MKFSEIPIKAPTLSDYLVGVTSSNVDSRFPVVNVGGRQRLTSDQAFFIATTGSDSNPGTMAQPWATLQHAMNFIASSLDIAGFNITVNVGIGSFAGLGQLQTIGGGNIMFLGNSRLSTFITNGLGPGTINAGECFSFYTPSDTVYFFDQMTFVPNAPAVGAAVDMFAPGILCIHNLNSLTGSFGVDLTNLGSGNVMWWIDSPGAQVVETGVIYTGGGGTISNIFFIEHLSEYISQGPSGVFGSLTISGTNSSFAYADTSAVLNLTGGTITGPSVTGQRYLSLTGATIAGLSTGSLGPNAFPGTVPGFADATASYDGIPGPIPGINTQTSNYILAFSDSFARVEMNLAGANTVTVPLNATVGFEIGTKITVSQIGAGATTIQGAAGVTVDNAGALSGRWGSAVLYKRGTDEWVQTNA